MPLSIAIIGGGPAGLTLARLLQCASIPCTIFEAESSAVLRDQGGTIDLHPRGGQAALVEAGLIDEFKRLSRPEGDADILVRSNGEIVLDELKELGDRVKPGEMMKPEIDRNKLRDMLLDSLDNGTIHWGKKVLSIVESAEAGKWDIVFTDTTIRGFDLVIGADGAWSKVRGLLSDVKPHYSTISAVELWATEVEEKHPWLSQYVGQGSLFMGDEGRGIICQRNGNNSIRTYACVRQPESWSKECGIDWSNPEEARKSFVDGYFADCGEDLQKCILESSDNMVVRPLYMLPVDMKWKNRKGITLIGDAAHLMTPFAGVGVNVAMTDSLELSKAIVSSRGHAEELAASVAAYETGMFKRANMYAKKTQEGLDEHFRATGCDERAAKFRKHLAEMDQNAS
jgi:2-polyprenyl-6-methoxyphenol hydroxylase-like FAD-dependent oxidoreductase